MDNKHSLKIKTKWIEASADGLGIIALTLLAAAAGLKWAGWW